MNRIKYVFMASVVALCMLLAVPVLVAQVNTNPQAGPNTAVDKLQQSPPPQQLRELTFETARNPQLLENPNCPIGPKVPWVMGSW